jgi:hypothetical protein
VNPSASRPSILEWLLSAPNTSIVTGNLTAVAVGSGLNEVRPWWRTEQKSRPDLEWLQGMTSILKLCFATPDRFIPVASVFSIPQLSKLASNFRSSLSIVAVTVT